MKCPNCNIQLPDNAKFCGRCGTVIGAVPPAKRICPTCGYANEPDMSFCIMDGARLDATEQNHAQKPPLPSTKTLTITRAAQLENALCKYKITVNGKDYGHIGVGKMMCINVTGDMADVEIACDTMMMRNHRYNYRIRLGEKPQIQFKTIYGGAINADITGAEIMRN